MFPGWLRRMQTLSKLLTNNMTRIYCWAQNAQWVCLNRLTTETTTANNNLVPRARLGQQLPISRNNIQHGVQMARLNTCLSMIMWAFALAFRQNGKYTVETKFPNFCFRCAIHETYLSTSPAALMQTGMALWTDLKPKLYSVLTDGTCGLPQLSTRSPARLMSAFSLLTNRYACAVETSCLMYTYWVNFFQMQWPKMFTQIVDQQRIWICPSTRQRNFLGSQVITIDSPNKGNAVSRIWCSVILKRSRFLEVKY